LFKSLDGGLNWNNLNQQGSFRNVSFDLRTGAVYAGGAVAPFTGNIIKSLDGGVTWTALNNGITATGMEVYVDPDDSSRLYAFQSSVGFFQGTAPGLFISTDGGASWKLQTVASQTANGVTRGMDVYSIGLVAANPPPAAVSVASIVSAASLQAGPVAAESIVIATGSHIATGTANADIDQPPMMLAGTTVNVTDSAGVTRPAVLFSVSAPQVTYQIPPGTAAGPATVTITAGDGVTGAVQVQVAAVAPGVYTLNAAGLVKAFVIRVSNGNQFVEDVYEIDPTGAVIARPITISNGDQVYLLAYGTGFRAAGADVTVTIGGDSPPVLYAGPQGEAVGVDQFNILIPPDLAAGGQQSVSLILTAAGQAANAVNLVVK
jgi:BNR/Asp-box repeat.